MDLERQGELNAATVQLFLKFNIPLSCSLYHPVSPSNISLLNCIIRH